MVVLLKCDVLQHLKLASEVAKSLKLEDEEVEVVKRFRLSGDYANSCGCGVLAGPGSSIGLWSEITGQVPAADEVR